MAGRGIAYTALGAGVLFFYSGLKGWGIVSTLQDIVTGKQPGGSVVNSPVDALTAQANGGTVAYGGSSSIAADAVKYQGHAYLYGGSPGKNGASPWDCSSFCNWVISHDLGLPWPGPGTYDGTSHGPPTGIWGAWFTGRGMTVSGGIASAQAGDVIVWTGHMGISLGNGQMISALNPQLGTLVTPVAGNSSGGFICVGRYASSPSLSAVAGTTQAAGTSTAGGRG